MNMEYFSIYVVFHWSCSSEFCKSHIDLIHILLDLYLSIHCWVANINDIGLLISKFTCSLLTYRKAVDFFILTCIMQLLFLTVPPGLWDPSSAARDRTCIPKVELLSLSHWMPGKSLVYPCYNHLLVLGGFFLVNFYFIYSADNHVISEQYYFFLSNLYTFSFLFLTISKDLYMMLKRMVRGTPLHVLDLSGNALNFLPLSMILAVVFFYRSLKKFPSILYLLRVFTMNGWWILSNAFSASIDMIMWFFFFILLMWCDINWFFNVAPPTYLVLVYNSYYTFFLDLLR